MGCLSVSGVEHRWRLLITFPDRVQGSPGCYPSAVDGSTASPVKALLPDCTLFKVLKVGQMPGQIVRDGYSKHKTNSTTHCS
jgi:hypothetical protein